MGRAVRIANVVVQGVIIALALAAATVLVAPRLLGWQVVTVVSGSMAPTYPVDTVLAITPVDPTDVRQGDVIAFEVESDRPLVAHRVMAIERAAGQLSFITKGDANDGADSDPVAASAVRGRVIFGTPHLGLFVRFVQGQLGFMALFVLPCIALIAHELLVVWRDRRAGTIDAPPRRPTSPALTVGSIQGGDLAEFWTMIATEDRYYEELDRIVRPWLHPDV